MKKSVKILERKIIQNFVMTKINMKVIDGWNFSISKCLNINANDKLVLFCLTNDLIYAIAENKLYK